MGVSKVEGFGFAQTVVKVDDLLVDSSYQRPRRDNTVRAIVSNFNAAAFQSLVVGKRPSGKLYVVEGQQRLHAMRELKKATVPVVVFASRGRLHEAEVFDIINNNRTKVDAFTMYTGLLLRREPHAVAMAQAGTDCGYTFVSGGTAKGTLACVDVIRKTFKRDVVTGRRVFCELAEIYKGEQWTNRVWRTFAGWEIGARKQGCDPWFPQFTKVVRNAGADVITNAVGHAIGEEKQFGGGTSLVGAIRVMRRTLMALERLNISGSKERGNGRCNVTNNKCMPDDLRGE